MTLARPAGSGTQRFRAERESDWTALEALLDTAERKSFKALSDDELVALPILYRSTLSSLSVARATSLDADMIAYLEGLSARAYFFVYGVRESLDTRLRRFFAHDWPQAVRAIWLETIAALALLAAGTLIGFLLVTRDPGWYSAFVPHGLASGRDPQATTGFLRSTLYGNGDHGGLGVLAAFLFTNNAQVAIGAFALGFAFGLPTAMLMLSTGTMTGAFFALFASRGLGSALGGWMMIHGTTELFAVVLAGAAGFRIGRSVAFPGRATRVAAAQAAGRQAATVMAGVGVMLFVAGCLEGFARQLIQTDVARYGIATAMLLLWTAYFYAPRRTARG